MRVWGAGLVGLSLVAAACGGGGDDEGAATQATVDEGVKAGIQQQLSGPGSATTMAVADHPDTMEAWEALWADQRETIVERIKSEGFGLSADGKTVTGPEGFTIDLSACPSGWTNTEGLSPTEIKLGHTTALSGTLADYGNISRAMQSMFAHYNAEGAFTDSQGAARKVNLLARDDGYDAARTIPLVDELIDSEKVFAMWTLGSANTMKTYDKLNQRCIPNPLAMTGHPAWGDPVNHPWTTGMQLAYNTEAVLWGSFIEQRIEEFGGKVKVASLVMNNDFGKAYDSGFRAFVAQSPLKDQIEYSSETIEPQAPTLKDPMTTLAAKDVDVFIAMMAGAPCTQAITEAAENGMKESVEYLFMPSVCKVNTFVGKDKVGGDGSASDGWWIVGGGQVDFVADANSDDAFVKWGRELLAKDGIDYHTSGSFGSGFLFGFPMVQALQIAGELDGGLNRTNFMVALRSLDMTQPMLLPGIQFNLNGNADAYFIEGSDIGKYDAAKQQWIQQGDIIELSGASQNCSWNQASGTCS